MKIIVSGGHFAPAYATIQELGEKAEIVVVGRKHTFEGDGSLSFEYKVYQELGIPFIPLKTARLQRKFTSKTIPSIAKLPLGVKNALAILKKERPDVLLLFGGYISLPLAFAGKILGIPIVIHEQTQHAGLSNKIIGKFCDKVCISFSSSQSFFPQSKIVLTGNPIRQEIYQEKTQLPVVDLPTIYITGGSAGSHKINEIIKEIVPRLVAEFMIIHQTGDAAEYKDFDSLQVVRKNLPPDLQKRYLIKKFITPSEIGFVYEKSDLIISRSGANTICELLVLEKMALLIPLPHGQSGEQLSNAQLIKKLGLGEYIEQKDATPKEVLKMILQMMSKPEDYRISQDVKDQYIHENASQKIAAVVQSINHEKKEKKDR